MTHEFDEARADAIGQNSNEGLHYRSPETVCVGGVDLHLGELVFYIHFEESVPRADLEDESFLARAMEAARTHGLTAESVPHLGVLPRSLLEALRGRVDLMEERRQESLKAGRSQH